MISIFSSVLLVSRIRIVLLVYSHHISNALLVYSQCISSVLV